MENLNIMVDYDERTYYAQIRFRKESIYIASTQELITRNYIVDLLKNNN